MLLHHAEPRSCPKGCTLLKGLVLLLFAIHPEIDRSASVPLHATKSHERPAMLEMTCEILF